MGTDAFGRSTGDDTPASTGATPTPLPAGVPGGRRPPIVVPGLLVALVLGVLSLGGTALVLVKEERAKVDDPIEQARRGAITNLEPNSFLRGPRLVRAYAAATRKLKPDEVITQLAVSPTALELYVRDEGAFQRLVRVDPAFAVTASDAGRSESAGLRPSDARLTGVPDIARRVLARIPEKTAEVQTIRLALTPTDGIAVQSEWRIDVGEVRPRDSSWFASVDGTRVRRSDEPTELTQEQTVLARPVPGVAPLVVQAPVATPTPAPAAGATPRRRTTSSSGRGVTVIRNGRRVRLTAGDKRRLQRCFERAPTAPQELQPCVEKVLG